MLGRSDSAGQSFPPWLAANMALFEAAPNTEFVDALRKWFLMTCSLVPTILPISRFVRPSGDRNRDLDLLRGEALAGCQNEPPLSW